MILRRVIEHFRKQQWTAIALDFAIVVLGVFIANMVTTWKDGAALAKREAAAIARLHDESEAIIEYVSTRVDIFEKGAIARDEALMRLSANDWAGADLDRAASALDDLGLAPAASPPRSVYDELISSGLFTDLGDAKLRLAIADYYAYLSFLQAQIDYVRLGIVTETAQRFFPGLKHVYDPEAFRGVRSVYDFPTLSGDPAFIDFALMTSAGLKAQEQWWGILLIKADAMCAEISRVDGRPCVDLAAEPDNDETPP